MTATTAAGRRATQAVPHFDWCAGMRGPNDCTCGVVTSIVAIEQEAVAAERARLRNAVAGISLPPGPDWAWVDGHRPFIAAVLALLEPGDG